MKNPKDFTKAEILTKWGDMIKHVTKLEKPEDIQKVSEFAHFYALNEYCYSNAVCIGPYAGVGQFKAPQALAAIAEWETRQSQQTQHSLLPLNLKILSQVTDLSNVLFMHAPVFEDKIMIREVDDEGTTCLRQDAKIIRVDTIKNKIKVQKDLMHTVFPASIMTEEIENIATEIVSKNMNTILSKNHKLYVYFPVERIKQITDQDNDFIEYTICSRWFEDVEKSISLSDL